MKRNTSYSVALKNISLLLASSSVTVLSGVIRLKIAAIILGPAGIGIIGIFQSLLSATSTLGSFGLNTVASREVSTSASSAIAKEVALVHLFFGLLLSFVTALILWICAPVLYDLLGFEAGDPYSTMSILAIGAAASVIAGIQVSILGGLKRVNSIVFTMIASGALAVTLAYSVLINSWPQASAWFVAIPPICQAVIGIIFVILHTRRPNTSPSGSTYGPSDALSAVVNHGILIMLGAVGVALSHLLVRVLLQRELGISALGQYQAASTISMTYLTVLLAAVINDFYPRLSAVVSSPRAARRLVNEQLEILGLAAAPVLVGVVTLAPYIMEALYSNEFIIGGVILRWQTVGDAMKIICVPLSVVLLATGRMTEYATTQMLSLFVFVVLTWALAPLMGPTAAALGYVAMYAVYLPLLMWRANTSIKLRIGSRVLRQSIAIICCCLLVILVGMAYDWMGLFLGILLTVLFSMRAAARFSQLVKFPSWLEPALRKNIRILSYFHIN